MASKPMRSSSSDEMSSLDRFESANRAVRASKGVCVGTLLQQLKKTSVRSCRTAEHGLVEGAMALTSEARSERTPEASLTRYYVSQGGSKVIPRAKDRPRLQKA